MFSLCWKQEWASAINNITRAISALACFHTDATLHYLKGAIVHITRAQVKLEKRLARNQETQQKLEANKKYCYEKMLAPVKALIEHNIKGITECKEVIANLQSIIDALSQGETQIPLWIEQLRNRQDQLYVMIHVYGIKHAENPKRVYALMGSYATSKRVGEIPIPTNYGKPTINAQAIVKEAKVGNSVTCEKCGKTRITRVKNPKKCPICGHVPGTKIRN